MRQRAGIARALLADPLVLLMDEPFGALDAQTRRFLQQELLRHWEERRKAVVFITHDVDEAVLLADRLLVLSGRPGKVMADFAVPLPRPRTPADTQRPEAAALKKQVWAMVEEQARYSLRALL
jgi:NitT/TauT family transport system ATP-binding protein